MAPPASSSGNSHPNSSPDTGIAAWRILFRMAAGIAALGIFAFWGAAGWNTGWTKNKIAIKQTDELTGLEYLVYKDHFAPGIELLALGLFACVVVFAVTFLPRRTRRAFLHT